MRFAVAATSLAVALALFPNRSNAADDDLFGPPLPPGDRAQYDKFRRAADEKVAAARDAVDRQRWTALPADLSKAYVSADGQPWFTGQAGSSWELKDSVEEAFAGKTHVIRGGELVLVDKRRRFWALSANHKRLLCYDGQQWSAHDAVAPTDPRHLACFLTTSFEDSVGSVYFISGDDLAGWAIHSLAPGPDARWQARPVIPEADAHDGFRDMDVRFFEQAGHRMSVCTVDGHVGDADKIVVPYFDGKDWSVVHPRVCREQYHDIRTVIPLPDGSIATICGGGHFWVYWPDAAKPAADGLNARIDQLSAQDPKARERAAADLIAMGAPTADALKALKPDALPPEARIRVAAIVATIQADAATDHKAVRVYGGRFAFRNGYFVTRSAAGRVWLYVDSCTDLRTSEEHEAALLSVEPDGTWNIHPAPMEQWRSVGLTRIPQGSYEDSAGRLWLQGTIRTKPDFTAERIDAAGISVVDVAAEDHERRFYFSGNPIYVLNDAAGQPAGNPDEQIVPATQFAVLPDATVAFAVSEGKVVRLDEHGSTPIVTPFGPNELRGFLPLRNGRVIARILSNGRTPERAAWFDGTDWTIYPTLQRLVEARTAELKDLAGHDFVVRDQASVTADDQGHLWFFEQGYRFVAPHDQQFFSTLRYFDGANWHDARAELTAQDARHAKLIPNKSFGHGRTLGFLALPQAPQVVASFDEAAKTVRAAPAEASEPLREPFASDLFTDAAGNRLLYLHPHGLGLVPAGQSKMSARVRVEGISSESVMTQSPDGRLWLVHNRGLSQIAVADGRPKEATRKDWPTPRNHFAPAFCDAANNLWFAADETRLVRVKLP